MNIQELLKCQQDFSYFVKNYVKITNPLKGNPLKGLIPFELHPYQKEFIDFCENNQYVIGIKFRQGGYTTVKAIHAYWKCLFQENIHYYIACRTENEAVHIGKILNLVDFPEYPLRRNTKNYKEFTNGNTLRLGSVDQIRMPASLTQKHRSEKITNLMIDEPAFIQGMDEKWKSVWLVSDDAKICAISTTNGVGNWFYETWKNSELKLNCFARYHGNYKDHPNYSLEWEKEQRLQLGEKAFMQEVLGLFVFDEPIINKMNHREIIRAATTITKTMKNNRERELIEELIHRFELTL